MKTLVKLLIVGAVLTSLTPLAANAQILATYDTTGSPNPLVASSVAANLTVSDFVYGPGFNGGFATSGMNYPAYGAYTTSAYQTTLADAVTANDYFTFTVTPASGSTLNLTDLDFSKLNFVTQNTTGFFVLQSSVDGYASNLASFASSPNTGVAGTDVTLDSSFSNLTTATTFRLYIYEPAADGTFQTVGISGQADGVGGLLDINGTITTASVSEPSTYALMLGGLLIIGLASRRPLLS